MAKKLLLSIPEPFLKKLNQEKQKYAYTSMQEIIIQILREKYFYKIDSAKPKVGRPRKLREEKIISRKKIFSKRGEPINI
tara:strand:+ start:4579 stop:4818 length:240 start_codon:yes stop_codon:yes gene_type:complete